MTNQEVFNKVWDHFITNNGKPSVIFADLEAKCQYRGPEGACCAVGLLLPDELYNPELEGSSAWSLLNSEDTEMIANFFAGVSEELLIKLQGAHDSAAYNYDEDNRPVLNEDFHAAMRENLINVAADLDLTIPA